MNQDYTEIQTLTIQNSWVMSGKQFYEWHIKNPSTVKGLTEAQKEEWTKTPHAYMDDQGFEGCFLHKDGKIIFHRWVEDDFDPILDSFKDKVKAMDNVQLEDAWQAQASFIQSTLMAYFNTKNEELREKAKDAQKYQSLIQDEITRRVV